jgi:hypothetical protein
MGWAVWFIAMILGVFFSCLVGFGLMGTIFFSSRHGYDEPLTFIRRMMMSRVAIVMRPSVDFTFTQ